jgi:hypothetical protein
VFGGRGREGWRWKINVTSVISIYAMIEQLSQVETVNPSNVVAVLNGTFDSETVNTSARKAVEAIKAMKR